MSKRTKRLILILVGMQIVVIIGLLILPSVVMAIPGRYRVALAERSPFLSDLAEGLIEQVSPSEEFLPAPVAAGRGPRITIPAMASIPAATATSTPTSSPMSLSDVNPGDQVNTPSPSPTAVPPSPTPTPTLPPLQQSVRLEGIQRIQQGFNNCGPANLTQVLNWYGNTTTQTDAATYLKPNPEDRNVSPWQLSDYVNEFTELRSTVHSGGNLELIKRFISSGYPVVVEKGYEPDTSGAQGWFGHYLTVFGYDEEKEVFNVMDTYLRVGPEGREESYTDLEYYWQHFNYSFYVVYRPEQESEVFQILGTDMLDPMTMWQNAAIMAQEDIDADPENALAWFNLGTSLTRMGELTGSSEYYENGAAAFDEARALGLPPRKLWYEHRPFIAYMKVGRYEDLIALADAVLTTQGGQNVEEIFLYKGHALLYEGDVNGAIEAYQKALQLNENFYPAQIALESLG